MKIKFKIENKAVLVLTGIFVVLVIIGCFRNLRTGIPVGDKFLIEREEGYYKSGDNEIRMIKGEGFTNFQIVFHEESMNAALEWSEKKALFGAEHDYAIIRFENGTVVEGTWFADTLVHDDGFPMDWGLTVYTDSQDRVRVSDEALSNVLCKLDLGMTTNNGSVWAIICGGLIYLIGALVWLYPEEMYFLGSRWRYNKAELSDDGIMMQRFSAILMLVMAAFLMINPMGLR